MAKKKSNLKKIKKEVYKETPILQYLGDEKDFKIIKAKGKNKQYLEDIEAGLEYYGKGTKSKDVIGAGYVPFKNKYRTLVNTEGKSEDEIKEMVKLDLVSHGLHDMPEYNVFTENLDKRLRDTYGDEMVDANGGVDAYIRGYISSQPEYAPYKEEMKFLDKGYFTPLDNILAGDPFLGDYEKNMNMKKNGGPKDIVNPYYIIPLIDGKYANGGLLSKLFKDDKGKVNMNAVGSAVNVGSTALSSILSNQMGGEDNRYHQVAEGALTGGLEMGAQGFQLGNLILPGIGGAIGAGVGALAGGITGGVGAQKAKEQYYKDMMAKHYGANGGPLKYDNGGPLGGDPVDINTQVRDYIKNNLMRDDYSADFKNTQYFPGSSEYDAHIAARIDAEPAGSLERLAYKYSPPSSVYLSEGSFDDAGELITTAGGRNFVDVWDEPAENLGIPTYTPSPSKAATTTGDPLTPTSFDPNLFGGTRHHQIMGAEGEMLGDVWLPEAAHKKELRFPSIIKQGTPEFEHAKEIYGDYNPWLMQSMEAAPADPALRQFYQQNKAVADVFGGTVKANGGPTDPPNYPIDNPDYYGEREGDFAQTPWDREMKLRSRGSYSNKDWTETQYEELPGGMTYHSARVPVGDKRVGIHTDLPNQFDEGYPSPYLGVSMDTFNSREEYEKAYEDQRNQEINRTATTLPHGEYANEIKYHAGNYGAKITQEPLPSSGKTSFDYVIPQLSYAEQYPNAYAEWKAENDKKANGGYLDTVEGPRHEGGGVNVGKNEVEGGEVIYNDDYVFSDRLINPNTRNLFSKDAEKIKERQEESADPITQRTVKKQLQELMQANESERLKAEAREDAIKADFQALGGYLNLDSKGKLQIDPEMRKTFTEAAKSHGLPTMEYASKLFMCGGHMKGGKDKYANGGPTDPPRYYPGDKYPEHRDEVSIADGSELIMGELPHLKHVFKDEQNREGFGTMDIEVPKGFSANYPSPYLGVTSRGFESEDAMREAVRKYIVEPRIPWEDQISESVTERGKTWEEVKDNIGYRILREEPLSGLKAAGGPLDGDPPKKPTIEERYAATMDYLNRNPYADMPKWDKLKKVDTDKYPEVTSAGNVFIPKANLTAIPFDEKSKKKHQFKQIEMEDDYIGLDLIEVDGKLMSTDEEFNKLYLSTYEKPSKLGRNEIFHIYGRGLPYDPSMKDVYKERYPDLFYNGGPMDTPGMQAIYDLNQLVGSIPTPQVTPTPEYINPFIDLSQLINPAGTNVENPLTGITDPENPPINTTVTDPENQINLGSEKAALLASSAPAIQNLIRSMDVEETSFSRITPETISLEGARKRISKEADAAKKTHRTNVRGTATSAGEALAALSAGHAGITERELDAIASTYGEEARTNADIKNRVNALNTEIETQETIARQQDRALADSLSSMALENIGTNLQGYMRDVAAAEENESYNKRVMSMLKTGEYEAYEKADGSLGIRYIGNKLPDVNTDKKDKDAN